MFITKVKKREKGRNENSDYLVQYMVKESSEGLSEQFRRYYGLKEIMPGSYFYLGDVKRANDYDWSGFHLQSSSH